MAFIVGFYIFVFSFILKHALEETLTLIDWPLSFSKGIIAKEFELHYGIIFWMLGEISFFADNNKFGLVRVWSL